LRKKVRKFNEKAVMERILLLRQEYSGGRGKSKFARALGISPSTYNYYESSRIPPIEILLRICQITGADLQWLLTGRCSQGRSGGTGTNLLRKTEQLLNNHPDLTAPIAAFIELLCEKKGLEKRLQAQPPPPKPKRPGWIPVLGRTAAGLIHSWDQTVLPKPREAVTELEHLVKKHLGETIVRAVGGTIDIDLQTPTLMGGLKTRQANLIQTGGQESDRLAEFLECEEVFSLFPDCFALRVDGDSMSPRINDGDFVMVSPSLPAANGQIAVSRIADQIGVTCKLVRTTDTTVHLIPINEKYDTKVVPKKNLLWSLAVLCHVRPG